jgi:CBS-domain-containing membrane protein
MNAAMFPETRPCLVLRADTAADLMTPNPVSVREDANVREALNLLIDKGFSAAPVIDRAGRPVGVLSNTDLLVHDRANVERLREAPEYFARADLKAPGGEALGRGFQVEKVDPTRVRDLMTPAVFSVAPDAPAAKVVNELLSLRVHRLFVVDENGVLVGVISTVDVLRHLQP